MNRSTGLLRAYASLLRRVSGADALSLFAPAIGESNPIYLTEGDLPLPEHADLDRARQFHAEHEPLALERRDRQGGPIRVDSVETNGWLVAVPCAPFGRRGPAGERRRARAKANGAASSPAGPAGRTGPARDDSRFCWIGARFEAGEHGSAKSADAFRLLAGGDPSHGDNSASLSSLGGILAWYAWQISSILDDPVTGLAGRAEFQASLSHAFAQARETGRPLSLLFVNPDDFTSVNERFGHEAGDRVLKEIGERLRAAHRSSDSIAKYGGAIFASFLVDADLAAARIVAEKVWTTLAKDTYLDSTLRLGISVGLAVYDPPDPGIDGHLELIRRADKALNAAKRYGGDHVASWERELETQDLGSLDRLTGVYTGNMAKDYRNMTLLSDTMSVVAGSSDVDDLLEQLVERLHFTLRADRVGLFEWDEEGSPLLVAGVSRSTSSGGGAEPARGMELDEAQLAVLEQARRERRPVFSTLSERLSQHRIRMFAAPLILNELCLGCLYLDGRSDTLALEGSSDLGFLRAFATQLAVALDRARLSAHQKRQQEREHLRLRAEVDDLRRALNHTRLVSRSPEMDAILDTVRRVAPTKATVLVIGESGTGKELVARTLHELSPFRKKPLVVVDCGAIPTTLVESELFGHERGAYTGAQERRIGRLLEADGGTVVLDEIGELPLEVQSKLLRFVQERQVVPVGGTQVLHVDTRLIAVTNRELAVEAAAGRFREDLYYRLNVVRITVPPLRERPDDILHLADYFLEHFAQQYQKGPLSFSETARERMHDHHWPGNVRELSNRIMQAVILSERSEIGVRELELEGLSPDQTVEIDLAPLGRSRALPPGGAPPSNGRLDEAPSAGEAWHELRVALRRQVADAAAGDGRHPLPLGTWLAQDLVLQAYEAAGGVAGRARTLLGIPETTFRRRLHKATSQERAGLRTRKGAWDEVLPRIAALVRSPEVAHGDVLDVLERARSILLREVRSQVDDPALGAALMGVTGRTYRRWIADLQDSEHTPRAERLASAV